jgi:hypothetical protein
MQNETNAALPRGNFAQFGFRADYDLHRALSEVITRYRQLSGSTPLQRRVRRDRTKHWLKIVSKQAWRGDRKRFRSSLKKASLLEVIYLSLGGSNPFQGSLKKSARAGRAALKMMKRPGRPKDDTTLLLYGLVHIYEKGTGKRAGIPSFFWAKERIESAGPFFRFVTEVFKLAGIEHKPGVLAKQIQRRINELRSFRAMRGVH